MAAAGLTADELLSGVRSDLQTTCSPLLTDLPESAIAAVECTPKSDVVDHVRLYLFGTQQGLLDAYGDRMTAHDVPSRTKKGRCLTSGASEGAYVPEGSGFAPERSGCYVDANGKARYVATAPPFVLVEVDGTVGDIAAVEGWAWLGNQDQPGAPTVWRGSDQ